MSDLYEIREWIPRSKKKCVRCMMTLDVAFDELKKLREEEPERVYSIFKIRGGRENEYKINQITN